MFLMIEFLITISIAGFQCHAIQNRSKLKNQNRRID